MAFSRLGRFRFALRIRAASKLIVPLASLGDHSSASAGRRRITRLIKGFQEKLRPELRGTTAPSF